MSQDKEVNSTTVEEVSKPPLPDENLFVLKKHFIARGLKLVAFSEIGRKQLLAFVGEGGDLSLHFLSGEPPDRPIMKLIPWFADQKKRITAMCFDPSGSWLLIAGYDNSLFVIPALALVDTSAPLDHRWNTDDVTIFPPIAGAQSSSARSAHPVAVVWWQSVLDCQHTAVVGNDRGDITFISLNSGSQIAITYVKAPISSLQLCQDNSMDSLFLLITDENCGQWKLLLEQRTSAYNWMIECTGSGSKSTASDIGHSSVGVDLDFSSKTPTTRSRLQGLKQLSVEKLASLRQRLAETRSKGVMMSASGPSGKKGLSTLLRETESSSGSSSSDETSSLSSKSKTSSASDSSFLSSGPTPERLSSHVGDTFLQPQYTRGRYLLSGYYAPTSILTIHGMSLEVVPLFVHKLPPNCKDILVTDRFIFVTDLERKKLCVVSSQLSESRLDGDTEFNPDCVISTFEFDDENIIAIFKCTGANYKKENIKDSTETSAPEESGKDKNTKSSQSVPTKEFKPVKLESSPVDSCVVITSMGMYSICLRCPATDIFLELVLQHEALERAERLALMFGLNLQELLEHAGDLRLAARNFPQAISLYKLSKCRHLKSVLKFAAGGHSAELLSYVNLLFTTSGIDLTASEKIHLSNLAVMSNTEQVLRSPTARANLFKSYLQFLRENFHYDEVLAVNVAGQTGLWDILQFLATSRGLHSQVLDVLTKIMRSTSESKLTEGPMSKFSVVSDSGLWLCLSDPALQQAILARPQHARVHLQFVETNLNNIETFALQRLAAMYDPSAPVARLVVQRMLRPHRHRAPSESSSCCSGVADSMDMMDANVNEDALFPAEQLIQMFLLVLLHLAKKTSTSLIYDADLMKKITVPQQLDHQDCKDSVSNLPLRMSNLSAGFSHMALVRNGTVYTWGGTVLGCLGTGPTLSRYSTPQPITLFPSLMLEVHSVACGRQHTLALTNNGVYAWGSSQFGQLGIGKTAQSPSPRLVESLAHERIVAISAGQYHSMALADDGRLFTWGWGVHGQLGHKSVEDEILPVLVQRLAGKVIVQVCGGHAHSLVLTAEGSVLSFGSNVFGQLGNGTNVKSSIPIHVAALNEPIAIIATGYFHNLAVSKSNKLYTWGSSPQVLRLQAQAQKKARLLHQQTQPQPQPQISQTAISHPPEPCSTGTSNEPESPVPDSSDEVSSDSSSADTVISNSPCQKQEPDSEASHEALPATSSSSSELVEASTSSPCRNTKAIKSKLTLDNINKSGEQPGKSISTQQSDFVLPEQLGKNKSGIPGVQWEGDENQLHLLPQQVDTTLVNGTIAQVSCGCHHSALLSNEGILYIWGRNLDGQVGNGSRKEVPVPTPLACIPTVSLKQATAGISNMLPGESFNHLQMQQVCCGCEFTAVLEASGGRVWAWGNNTQAQLGFPPVEDSKPLEGKLVMLKTSKRVIKLPHGMHNSCDSPREVSGLPTPSINYQSGSSELQSEEHIFCPSLGAFEQPCYGLRTFHYALQWFHGHYDSKQLLAKCLELENYQAAARLAALDRKYHVALAYQLKALACSSQSATLNKNLNNLDSDTNNVHLKNDKNINRNNKNVGSADATHMPEKEIICKSQSGAKDDSVSKENHRNSKLEETLSSTESTPHKTYPTDECRSPSISSNPESITSLNPQDEGEMHAFSIQGGREQMFDRRGMGSPDSTYSQIGESQSQTPTHNGHTSSDKTSCDKILDDRVSAKDACSTSQPFTCEGKGEVSGQSKIKNIQEEEDLILKTELEGDKQPEIIMDEDVKKKKHKKRDHIASDQKDLVDEASSIVEYYVSVMEEDSHTMMGQMLQQGLEFWLSHSLPVDHLENLLMKHISKFCYPLGLLLFCRGSSEASKKCWADMQGPGVLNQLSTRFCLQLCTLLLGHIGQRKAHQEYVEVLSQLTTQGLNGCSDQQMDRVVQALRSLQMGGASQAFISISSEEVHNCSLTSGEQLLVFSCGHRYGSRAFESTILPELESGLRELAVPLPASICLLQTMFNTSVPTMHLACPRCVLSHLQALVPA